MEAFLPRTNEQIGSFSQSETSTDSSTASACLPELQSVNLIDLDSLIITWENINKNRENDNTDELVAISYKYLDWK